LLAIDPDSTVLPTEEQLNAKKGWYMPFGTGDHEKEQVVTSAVAVLGVVTFSTHIPTPKKRTVAQTLVKLTFTTWDLWMVG